MDKHYIIETLGDIWKQVTLRTMDVSLSQHIFAMESMKPYPGYHHATPHDQSKNPGMVFLVLKSPILTEDFIRMTQKVKKIYSGHFDGTPAVIHILNNQYDAIRIKDYGDLNSIPEIIAHYSDEGAQFRKYRTLEGTAIIKLTKYMVLEQVSDDLYTDAEDPNMAYFELPCQVSWKLFEKVTLHLKRNTKDANWDVALGVIYRKTGVVDVVRVYAEDCTRELVEELHKRYASEINRYI